MIIEQKDFDFRMLRDIPCQKRRKGNPGRRNNKRKYKDIICAFDIEATNDRESEQAFMYVWQFQIGNDITIIGHYWAEFLELLTNMREYLNKDEYIIIFVHNLSYEFQFLRGIYPFNKEEVFAIQPRKVLKCEMLDHFEFRCSYLLTNMSLAEFTSRMGIEAQKLSGEKFDYSIQRYPWTELNEYETQYIINDVLGLVQALRKYIDLYQDNFYTLPLTSTGFVRRDVKAAMRHFNKYELKDMLPDYDIFTLLSEAFRGGNTHANRYYSDMILKDVKSRDFSSAYPSAQINLQFPMSPFIKEDPAALTLDRVIKKIYRHCRACLMKVELTNIRLSNKMWGFPYLAKAKCENILNCVNDNGRIISADYLVTTLTDLDLKIILQEYEFDDITFIAFYHSRYGRLPKPLRETVQSYFNGKTELKGVEGQELYYMKAKNMLNSIYGMTVQSPVKQSIDFINEFIERQDDPRELLEKSNQRAFLTYAWGVWTTAQARYELEQALRMVSETPGAVPVYCDTDSVKYIGEVDFTKFNKEREQRALKNGGFAYDPAGNIHYLGVMEADGIYNEFATMGAKKYAFVENGKLGITIAGVNKRLGAAEMAEAGGLAQFKEGFVFRKGGGTESKYNDDPEIKEIIREGKTLQITSNVYISNSEYTLGVTGDYRRILENAKIWRDMLDIGTTI